ncbi:TPA: hypothetical protein JLU65_003636 [Escherichia coli]|nr:hypothetical protein [Escherichia coli]HAW4333640.1 hypothetical protein [Escherichia coli]
MNKKLLAMGLLLSMTAGSAMAAANSGTTIGTGATLAVTGTVGTSTCSVTFPQSVAMPSVTTAMYNATQQLNAMAQQPAGNIQFSGCSGQSVNLKVLASNVAAVSGNKKVAYPKLNNKGQGWLGLSFAVSTDGGSVFKYLNLDNSPSDPISVTSDTFAIPVRIDAVKMLANNNASDIGQGNYSSSFVVTATYA